MLKPHRERDAVIELRDAALLERHGGVCFDAIADGYGFGLGEGDVLDESRNRFDDPEPAGSPAGS